MMTQKTAVCNALLSVLADRGVTYELNGPTPIADVLTSADIETVKSTIVAGFLAGKIEMSEESKAKYNDEASLKKYVPGLVNNWIRKEKTFNGGNAYQAKNPGSRAGSGDEQIKEMKKLLSLTTDPEGRAEIQTAIDARVKEIGADKGTVEIDVSKLPESLRHLAK